MTQEDRGDVWFCSVPIQGSAAIDVLVFHSITAIKPVSSSDTSDLLPPTGHLTVL